MSINAPAHVAQALAQIQNRAPPPEIDFTQYILQDGTATSTQERVVKDVQAPLPAIPTPAQFFAVSDPAKPDIAFLKNHFYREGRLSEEQALYIIEKATDTSGASPICWSSRAPSPVRFVAFCGDIHGQYVRPRFVPGAVEIGGNPVDTPYLFLGDYVGRGYFSIECVLYLWALKIWYPTSIFLLRGNHECRHLMDYFTFKLECKHKYSEHICDACTASFCSLPPRCRAQQAVLVHPRRPLPRVHYPRTIDRFREPPTRGVMCDILWSDPAEDFGSEKTVDSFCTTTYQPACNFLERSKLLSIIRVHEAQDSGQRYRKTKTTGFPSVITVFSAPNYLDMYNNKGAVIKYANNVMNITQFSCSPHPYWLPNFMDMFTWSLPFVGEKNHGHARRGAEHLHDGGARRGGRPLPETPTSPSSASAGLDARRKVIKNKIMAVGRMSRVFTLLREESEKVSELKSISGSSKLPYGSLAFGSDGIKNAITGFDQAALGIGDVSATTPGKNGLALDTAVSPASGSPFLSLSASPSGSPSMPFRYGQGRQASVGTTMTSPSTGRRGLEDTISLIQGVWDRQAEGSIAEEAARGGRPAAACAMPGCLAWMEDGRSLYMYIVYYLDWIPKGIDSFAV
ncbi:serine/threonine protein phosphatase 2B [Mycena albidolilacea]|uniref:Serine/threonine-protein phosphatase n=1 Tax=Mycena albidolilacea TaxID=1033008 RepID=A0AAD7AHZ6_9AGAR|nr:serine/threonine protein phosphatase 2B [Mycena albidolilacea]